VSIVQLGTILNIPPGRTILSRQYDEHPLQSICFRSWHNDSQQQCLPLGRELGRRKNETLNPDLVHLKPRAGKALFNEDPTLSNSSPNRAISAHPTSIAFKEFPPLQGPAREPR